MLKLCTKCPLKFVFYDLNINDVAFGGVGNSNDVLRRLLNFSNALQKMKLKIICGKNLLQEFKKYNIISSKLVPN